ncbi:hypothetical protein [Mycolicibacterium sp.]|uniref:hypothetical protein n=1 Tax=Mycolicibacterium sp. TaxID=2320850 RepID=UPI0028AB9566|nr:hypothetical protein [Mycolicibacterium sp.]
MTLLDVTSSGLATLAGRCGMWAGEVAVVAAPKVPTGHASAAAVAAVHARVGVSGAALGERMGATAGALSTAAAGFTSQDDESAGRIAGVAGLI